MTIHELLDLYKRHHLAGKPSAPYYARLVKQVFPPLASYEIHLLPKIALLEWWTSLRDRPGHANKALGHLRAATRWAIGLELIDCGDPTIGIKKCYAPMRSTTTSPEEWGRVAPLLEDLKLRHRVFFWAQYLLGNRPGETRNMETVALQFDREIPVWVLPTSKNGMPHMKPLPSELVPMLRLVVKTNPPGTRYVFWGQSPAHPWGRTSMQKMWEKIRAKAGLPHLWPNDLRRSTASDLLNQGESIGVVQGALNHRSLSQTAKYAWLAIRPLSDALQKREDTIVGKLTGMPDRRAHAWNRRATDAR